MADARVVSIAAVVLATHVWATVRIVRSELPGRSKLASLAAAWLVPLLGPIGILVSMPRRRAASNAAGIVTLDGPPPPSIAGAGSAFVVEEHLMNGNGFPILDWRALDAWVDREFTPAERTSASGLGRRAWLRHLRHEMNGVELVETPDAWVLSSYEPNLTRAVADFISTARRRIAKLLAGIARFPPGERTIFIAFDSRDDYYRYVANYYPEEGEFAFTGGMYVNAGCPHFVTVKDELWRLEPVIAHELTHAALAHLRLPLWIDEGIAVTTEHHVAPAHSSAHRHHLETLEKHLNFWNPERLQEFWTGESFHRPDEGQTLSYDLARHIVGLLGREWSSFVAFVNAADRADAGAAAARSAFGMELGALAAAALRVAPQAGWDPNPATWRSTRQR